MSIAQDKFILVHNIEYNIAYIIDIIVRHIKTYLSFKSFKIYYQKHFFIMLIAIKRWKESIDLGIWRCLGHYVEKYNSLVLWQNASQNWKIYIQVVKFTKNVSLSLSLPNYCLPLLTYVNNNTSYIILVKQYVFIYWF